MYNKKIKLKPNTIIIGKWNHHHYQIVSLIGSGSHGIVYLVRQDGKEFALKIGTSQSQLYSEVNSLKKHSEAQGAFLGPSLYDVDDWDINGSIFPFYVMEYIQGETFPGKHLRLGDSIKLLLGALQRIHDLGYCFGDIQPSNILIERKTEIIRFIDYGGLTPFGQSVKEYSPLFDRGSWGSGERKSSVQYDLFSVSMLIIFCTIGYKKINERSVKRSPQMLYDIIQSNSKLRKISPILLKGIHGHYDSAQRMLSDWNLHIENKEAFHKPIDVEHRWINVLFAFSLLCCGFMAWLNFM